MGCLLTIFCILIFTALSALGSFILTYITLWISNGLFNYPLDDKFWYIFVIWFIFVPVIKGLFNIKVN